jgi:hypothetical protein
MSSLISVLEWSLDGVDVFLDVELSITGFVETGPANVQEYYGI